MRYTSEEKALDGTLTTYASFVPPLGIDASHTWTSTDWRAGLQYDVNPQAMLYATVATGFHSGGFFFTHDNPIYQPERLKAYTLGTKSRFLDQRLQTDLEVFYWDYRNQQLSGVSSDSSGSTIFATVNAASSKIKGAEADIKYLPVRNTLLGLEVQYLHSNFQNFRFIQPFPASHLSACGSTYMSPGHFDVNCSGLQPPQSPKWTANLDLQQTFPLPGGASLVGALDGHWQTQSFMAMNYLPTDLQKGYGSGDASLTYHSPDGKWTITTYVDNVTNAAIMDSTNHPNVDSAALRAPRLYGVKIGVDVL